MLKNGILPYKGSLSEQPNKIIEYFKCLDYLYNEFNKENNEKAKREANKASRQGQNIEK